MHADRQEPGQPGRQFRVLRHPAFDDEAGPFRIEADREPVERHFPDSVANARKVLRVIGELVVGDQEVAVIFILQLEPVFESAGVMAEVQRPGRSNAGENAFSGGWQGRYGRPVDGAGCSRSGANGDQ